ncbi:hypothetical protein PNOK_0594700 [Pyrrhoderma noxium]|uniref:Uncharacterized protein n=1 Tax=Pyrrhoderma noxium TaxID=2282107 RepID=A0A286UHM3_9AGAM|nr:hypothetical protein PNOK_0594700 [Pyrrhoderma noxium]
MSTPCHSQSEMLFHREISEPPTCPFMERTPTNMRAKPHLTKKDDDINHYYDAMPPDLIDSKSCSFSSPIRPSYPGIVSNTMIPGSIPTRIREDRGHIETDRQVRNGGIVLAVSPRSATGRKGNRDECIDISKVQHIQGAPQISSRGHHGGLYTTKKGIEPTLTQCASTPQRSSRNRADSYPTIDAYSVVLGDKDATWSTLPMRKKTRKEESKAFSTIRQSKKFILPIKLPFSGPPLRDLNYVSDEQGNIPNTSSRRVVTYIPPPRGTDVSNTTISPNSRKENNTVLRPASEWSIKRFTFDPKVSSDSAMRTNGTNKLDSTPPSKRLRVAREVPIKHSLLTTAGDNQRRQFTSNEAQVQTHRTDDSPIKESDISTLLSDGSSDTNSSITAYKPTTFSGTTSPDSAKETIRSEDNDDTDMSVYLDISALERTYPQTRAMILEVSTHTAITYHF